LQPRICFEEGPRNDWLEDDVIASFAWLAVVGGCCSSGGMFTYKQPIVWLKAFHDRNFAIGSLYSSVLASAFVFDLSAAGLPRSPWRRFNSLQTRPLMIVTGAFQFASAPDRRALSKRLDLRVMLALGLSALRHRVYCSRSRPPTGASGNSRCPRRARISLMLCFIPINTLALGTLPRTSEERQTASTTFMRNLGGAIAPRPQHRADRPVALHYQRIFENITDGAAGRDRLLDGPPAGSATMVLRRSEPGGLLRLSLNDWWRAKATVLTFNDASHHGRRLRLSPSC